MADQVVDIALPFGVADAVRMVRVAVNRVAATAAMPIHSASAYRDRSSR